MIAKYFQVFKYYFFLSKLQKQKQKSLREVECDIMFLEDCKAVKNIGMEINVLRDDLKNERAKGEKADQIKLTQIAYDIADKERLQNQYNNLQKAHTDLQAYDGLIKRWKKQLWIVKL